MSTVRFDTFALGRKHKTAEGYLRVHGTCARAGVLEYHNDDGTVRRELVLPEELSESRSLDSIRLKPVTDDHPPELITVDDVHVYAKGVVLESVSYNDSIGQVELVLLVQHRDLIDKIERGEKRELSCGYEIDRLDDTAGVHPIYGQYDAIQRGRLCNHVAVVKRGRAGSSVSLRMDSADGDAAEYYDTPEGLNMADKKTDKTVDMVARFDKAIEQMSSLAQKFDEAMEQKDADGEDKADEDGPLAEVAKAMQSVVKMMNEIKSEAEEKQDEYADMKGRLESLYADFQARDADEEKGDMDGEEKQDRKDATPEKARLDWYNERRDLEEYVDVYKLDADDAKGLTNGELKRKIVEAHIGEERADASDAEINGAFDMVKRIRQKRADSYSGVGERVIEVRRDGAEKNEADAEKSYREQMYNGWKDA